MHRTAITAVVTVAALLATALPARADEEIAEGLPAPGFSLRQIFPEPAGRFVALDRFAGEEPEDDGAKVVLLSFFASWCAPCKKEMPFLVQLDALYRAQGLRILGVTIDQDDKGVAAAKKMAADHKVTYPVLSDRMNFLARRYLGEKAPLPSVFLIRRDGTIVKIERGYAKDASSFLLAEVQTALGLRTTASAPTGRAAPPARPAPVVAPFKGP
jgi:peroxiredoxin